jgi:hypothetical protein
MLARKAKEHATLLVDFACWSSAIAMEWAKYDIVRINLRLYV